jgi:pantetheine-phosphate adenylyltransferase
MKIGLLAGSFDPITKGHTAVVRKALHVVDHIYILVAINPDKKGMFDVNERVALISDALIEELSYIDQGRIELASVTESLTVEYAKLVGATILIRGIRNGADYAYERSIAVINKKLAPEIETIFIPTPVEYEEVSSSTVKNLMKFRGGAVAASDFVTPKVLEAIRNKSLL